MSHDGFYSEDLTGMGSNQAALKEKARVLVSFDIPTSDGDHVACSTRRVGWRRGASNSIGSLR